MPNPQHHSPKHNRNKDSAGSFSFKCVLFFHFSIVSVIQSLNKEKKIGSHPPMSGSIDGLEKDFFQRLWCFCVEWHKLSHREFLHKKKFHFLNTLSLRFPCCSGTIIFGTEWHTIGYLLHCFFDFDVFFSR